MSAMPSPPPLLEVAGLVKDYPGLRAVDGIAFQVPAGSCFGLLGPNGAGKTTTLEILEGITEPDAGHIRFDGRPRDAGYREVIGIQFQSTALQDFQTVGEALDLFASFYARTRPRNELIRLCHLEDLLDRDTRTLSGGQRQRLLLAIALVNDPRLVFLDEPTTGLDPQARRNFWQLIDGIRAAGKTVLLTTHYMEEASVLCDQVAIVDRGRIVEQGAPEDLLARHFPSALIRLPGEAASQPPPGFEHRGKGYVAATDDIHGTLVSLSRSGVPLTDLQVTSPTLEDLFLKLTGHDLRA
jgi:ABC-2 type transport system ATP-binding protein